MRRRLAIVAYHSSVLKSVASPLSAQGPAIV